MARLSLLAPILAIASACAASGEPGEVVVLVRADDGTYRLEPRDLGVRSFRPLASDRFVYVSNASVAFHDTSPVTVTVETPSRSCSSSPTVIRWCRPTTRAS